VRLTDLSPQFFRVEVKREMGKFLKSGTDPFAFQKPGFTGWKEEDFEEREHDQIYLPHVDSLGEADGITFLNPREFVANNGPVGTSSVAVYFSGRPANLVKGLNDEDGKFIRWGVSGTGYHDLTITPSIFVNPDRTDHPSSWHGFVTNGEVTGA